MQSLIFKDARYFQIVFQLFFLAYGMYALHWATDAWLLATYLCTSVVVQLLCEMIVKRNKAGVSTAMFWSSFKTGLPSVFISSLGLILLLKTNEMYVAAFGATVSIASKYLLRINGKHIFNPSALGIAAALLITGNAWISPGQWGSGVVIFFAAICFGSIIVTRVQKLDVSLAFLVTYAGLLFFRQIIFLGWPIDFFVQSLSTGSLLLFSFFMITDPKTTPNHSLARIVWSISIASVAFYLTVFKFMNGAPILVLLCMQPLVPLLDYLFKSKTFEWKSPSPQSAFLVATANK